MECSTKLNNGVLQTTKTTKTVVQLCIHNFFCPCVIWVLDKFGHSWGGKLKKINYIYYYYLQPDHVCIVSGHHPSKIVWDLLLDLGWLYFAFPKMWWLCAQCHGVVLNHCNMSPSAAWGTITTLWHPCALVLLLCHTLTLPTYFSEVPMKFHSHITDKIQKFLFFIFFSIKQWHCFYPKDQISDIAKYCGGFIIGNVVVYVSLPVPWSMWGIWTQLANQTFISQVFPLPMSLGMLRFSFPLWIP